MADDVTFCLMVPSGDWNLTPLVEAVRAQHPDADITAVWCGDPHLRPVLDAGLRIRWTDTSLAAPSGLRWGLLLTALADRCYEWCRTATAAARMLRAGASRVVVLRVGSVGVLAPCTSLWASDAPVTLVSRAPASFPDDGLAPDLGDLLSLGRHGIAMASFAANGVDALEWLSAHLAQDDGDQVGPIIDEMATVFDAAIADQTIVPAGWFEPTGASVAAVDLDFVEHDEPWHFSFGQRPSRVRLSVSPALAAAVESAIAQVDGDAEPVVLPGAIVVDPAIRSTVLTAIRQWREGRAALPPEPLGAHHAEFVAWLEAPEPWGANIGRYWYALRERRADLLTIFTKPQSDDVDRFREWIDASWRLEDERTLLIRPSSEHREPIVDAASGSAGVNVLGYFDFDQSQGHIAREMVAALAAADVPVAALNHSRSQGARRLTALASAPEARYATNLVVVNPDQFEFVVADHPQLLHGRRTIGYWFWELEDIPESFQFAIDHVDEIWTGSQFIADAFARVTDKPVRCVSLPIAEPKPSDRTRSTMHVPNDAYVFLTTFDQFSVPERKNPFGSIDAFTRAFAEGEGPVLLIKTLNGSKGWRNHERLLLAASGRSDIVVWDEHLSRADQMAVLNAADCLVSLHRSEGLGLHCAEAMWLGKPVIATNYSGNVDFMDGSVAAMIDYDLIHVRHGEGIYPETAMWADPDLDQAADWMRRLVADPVLGATMGAAARRRMQQQPSLADAGRRMAELAGIDRSSTHEAHEGAPR